MLREIRILENALVSLVRCTSADAITFAIRKHPWTGGVLFSLLLQLPIDAADDTASACLASFTISDEKVICRACPCCDFAEVGFL